MGRTLYQKASKASSPTLRPEHLPAETRIVTQEIVRFFETVYHTVSYLKSLTNPLFSTGQDEVPLVTQCIVSLFEAIYHTTSVLKTLYLFTASDFPTFAIPTLLFGVFSALSGPVLTTATTPSLVSTLLRIPQTLLLIWTNLLVFNISNQRTPSAVEEDALNKPHRPIPSGRITIEQARQVNLVLVPVLLTLSWLSGVWHETLILLAVGWMYNDLGGGEESLLLRNGLVTLGYGLYSAVALSIMVGPSHGLTMAGYQWLAIITSVMFTTQHITDLKDAPGDALRGRQSAPIALGDALCRWSVSVPIIVASVLCPSFFGLGVLSYASTLGFGVLVAGRTLLLRDVRSDKLTWKLWALWTCSLFTLPLAASLTTSIDTNMLWEAAMHYTCPGHDCAERLNTVAVSGVALAVKGSNMIGRVGMQAEGNMTSVPSIVVDEIVA